MKIKKIESLQIINSRGIPTLKTLVYLDNGIVGWAMVPEGISKGEKEAKELRDGNKDYFSGKSLGHNIQLIESEISKALKGMKISEQSKIDQKLIEIDGTKDKSKLGANTILSVSLACVRAGAINAKKELFEYIGSLDRKEKFHLPTPLFNLINGGKHANNNLEIQEFLAIPKVSSFFEAIRVGAEIYLELKKLLKAKQQSLGLGEEGGFVSNLENNKEALNLLKEAIEHSGHSQKAILGIDAASNSFFEKQNQHYILEETLITGEQLLSFFNELSKEFPLQSFEDPLAETDLTNWPKAKEILKGQIVGDDLFVTNKDLINKLGDFATAVIIKPNQIGTFSETLEAIKEARRKKLKIIISHRSGETEDPFIADLAVGVKAQEIKAGSLARSERLAKYNRLLEIEKKYDLPYFQAL